MKTYQLSAMCNNRSISTNKLRVVLYLIASIAAISATFQALSLVPWDGDTADFERILLSVEARSAYTIVCVIVFIAAFVTAQLRVVETHEMFGVEIVDDNID